MAYAARRFAERKVRNAERRHTRAGFKKIVFLLSIGRSPNGTGESPILTIFQKGLKMNPDAKQFSRDRPG